MPIDILIEDRKEEEAPKMYKKGKKEKKGSDSSDSSDSD